MLRLPARHFSERAGATHINVNIFTHRRDIVDSGRDAFQRRIPRFLRSLSIVDGASRDDGIEGPGYRRRPCVQRLRQELRVG
jgi:hypothetical protein